MESKDNKTVQKRVKNREVFAKIAKNLKVLARSTPEDKHLLVTGKIIILIKKKFPKKNKRFN